MKCVALQCALADALSLRIYDETISLYDTAEQIRLKLSPSRQPGRKNPNPGATC